MLAGAVLTLSAVAYAGRVWWLLDLVANFRIQLAIVGLVVAVGGLVIRARPVVVLGAMIVGINLAPILPLYAGGDAGQQEAEFRVVSYNLLLSGFRQPEQVIEWLGSVEADVVFLYEAGRPWTRLLQAADLPWIIVGPDGDLNKPSSTLALVGPQADVEFVDLVEWSAPIVTIDVKSEAVTLIGMHAPSPYSAQRARERDAELLAVADWVTEQTGHVVVAGDFNATPFSWSFRRMLDVTGLENSLVGFGLQPTWPVNNVLFRSPIDHLLYSNRLVVVDRQVLDSLGSDHYPIAVDLAINE